jgi:hypothetical protein
MIMGQLTDERQPLYAAYGVEDTTPFHSYFGETPSEELLRKVACAVAELALAKLGHQDAQHVLSSAIAMVKSRQPIRDHSVWDDGIRWALEKADLGRNVVELVCCLIKSRREVDVHTVNSVCRWACTVAAAEVYVETGVMGMRVDRAWEREYQFQSQLLYDVLLAGESVEQSVARQVGFSS